MDLLDIFALLILTILGASLVGLWGLLGMLPGMLPGMIARKRKHPQADAISVCGWWGAVTLGVLSPIAYVWAYSNPFGAIVKSRVLEKFIKSGVSC